nr:transposase [Actinoplanes sp. NBRC 101535]
MHELGFGPFGVKVFDHRASLDVFRGQGAKPFRVVTSAALGHILPQVPSRCQRRNNPYTVCQGPYAARPARRWAGAKIRRQSCWILSRSGRQPCPGRDHRQGRGERVPGRKRGLAVDALGLIIAVVVTAASVTDTAIGVRLLDKVVEHTPTVTLAWVDAGFKHELGIHGAVLGVDVGVVKRSDTKPGFVPIAKRWVVEQVNGTLMPHRRLVREYESRPESSVSRTRWASAANLVRRLTGTSTPSWRDPA